LKLELFIQTIIETPDLLIKTPVLHVKVLLFKG